MNSTNSVTIEQKELIKDGNQLLSWIKERPKDGFSDYSFLVAPFAKAYEGFLKGLFLRHHLITEKNYSSDRFRVGKVLNPALQHKKWSVYRQLEEMGETGVKVAQRLWQAWKQGRNLIFHYFPHNYQKLTLEEAEERINGILAAMREAEMLL